MRRLACAIICWLLSLSLASATPQVIGATTSTGGATLTLTVAGVSPLNWYVSGFMAGCGNATTAITVQGTLQGLLGGTMDFVVSSGALVAGPPTIVTFPTPIPNASQSTSLVLTITTPTGAICAATIFGELR